MVSTSGWRDLSGRREVARADGLDESPCERELHACNVSIAAERVHTGGSPPASVVPQRYERGYETGASGRAQVGTLRPLLELKRRSLSSANVPARAREWTRVPYVSFPRNEGVPGSSPGVGSLNQAVSRAPVFRVQGDW